MIEKGVDGTASPDSEVTGTQPDHRPDSTNEPTLEKVTGPQAAPADMHTLIGRQLRAVFDDVAKQPVPDRFLELMRQLDSGAGGR